jgi:gliding motility-associated-like protein
MYTPKPYLLLLGFIYTTYIFGHTINNQWYFGNNAALNFNSGSPVSIPGNAMVSVEGCASVSDSSGNLLFYTNGLQVWNANNQVMPNGNGLLAGPNTSSVNGAVIVPQPYTPNIYYIFTTDELSGPSGLRYSIVDMNLNGGLGDVTAQKNILLYTPSSEKICVAPSADGCSLWVITHGTNNNRFSVFNITANGLNANPVVSNVGSVSQAMGQMKVSPQYNKIAMANFEDLNVELYDFNNSTGIVSNPIQITTFQEPYGIEFSPDGSRLYYTLEMAGALVQLTLTNPTQAAISASAFLIAVTPAINQQMGGLQLAPDNKIYASIVSEQYVAVINQPNLPGNACNYVENGVILNTGSCLINLPAQVVKIEPGLFQLADGIKYTDTCVTSIISISLTGTNLNFNSVQWNFGDVNSGAANVSTDITPVHQFSSPGTYTITAIVQYSCFFDTLTTNINISSCDTAAVICTALIEYSDSCLENGTNFSLTTSQPVISVQWLFGDAASANNTSVLLSPQHVFSSTGLFTVQASVTMPCGVVTDTLQILIDSCTTQINPDTTDTIEPIDTIVPICNAFFIPNAFTPNNDGLNDVFKILSNCNITLFDLSIYNRWGECVFKSFNENVGWDGTYQSQPCPPSVFVYYLKLAINGGEIETRKGSITLIR